MKNIERPTSHRKQLFIFIDGYQITKYVVKTRRLAYLTPILLLLLTFVACNKNKEEYPLNGPILSMADIAGTWNATTANFSGDELDAAGQPKFIDIIAEGGSVTLSIQSNGRFTSTIALPGEPDNISTGQLGFDEQWLAISFDEDPGEYEFFFIELVNNVLTLRGPAEFDFDDDGLEEPGSLDWVMERA